ncbi:uncharacterized protein MONBRDRAFT_5101 [Monosiga brevicollis MX1]|uniref:C-type lectin domain-containing protein n=1 Tax=Monosiga brevicollis TaxID=81824 RepID=A9UPX7_MONBE|nr:uncharacterized protein MONBRDRAFT_5101 [Monosiga brevicollis MX1]EDQ92497.1 predicted protein [Monosiga brevicollis MX1]|eukprot:XP_001742259.1 hypothetical protein [Monosiga brevicollis MX1]
MTCWQHCLFIGACLAIVLASVARADGPPCDLGNFQVGENNRQYMLVDTYRAKWEDAVIDCASFGASLADPSSPAAFEAISALFDQSPIKSFWVGGRILRLPHYGRATSRSRQGRSRHVLAR